MKALRAKFDVRVEEGVDFWTFSMACQDETTTALIANPGVLLGPKDLRPIFDFLAQDHRGRCESCLAPGQTDNLLRLARKTRVAA